MTGTAPTGPGPGLDEVLMARVAEGNSVAFETLVRRNMHRALVVAQGMMGDAADADEVVQEAFMRVWQHAMRWDPNRGLFTTWLHRIIMNLCLDRRRRPAALPIEAAGDMPAGGESAPEAIARRQRREAVETAMGDIPARQRAAITLFYFEGLSGKEAAAVLGVSQAGFEQLLLRARRAIKTALARRGLAWL